MGNNNKLFSIILISLLGLSALLSVLFAIDIVSEGLLIVWCYILLGIASVVAIVFPMIMMVQNPKKAKSVMIGVASLLFICVIGYFMSGNEVHINYDGDILADAGTSLKSEAGIIASYILLAGAIGVIIFAEVSKMLK